MKLVKKIKSKHNLVYNHIPDIDIIVFKKRFKYFDAIDYYREIKDQIKENGKYMIKKHELKHVNSWDRCTKNKHYFISADAGISYSLRKKSKDILYLDNFETTLELTKRLIFTDPMCLFSIVDRTTGKNIYVVRSLWYRAETNKNDRIFIK